MSALRVCCALMLAPALVVAQPGPAPARRSGRDAPPPAAEPVPTADVDTHKVQRGDTLWDLSARYLSSPWYWPKVWSYNPEIGNPHWIYPGNVVRLRPPGAQGAPAAAGSDEETEPAPELAGLSRADLAKPQDYGAFDDVTVGGPYKIGYQPRGAYRARRDSFVTQAQVDESGTITAAFEDKLLLTTFDRVYVRFHGDAAVQPGATYALYETQGSIRHPVTGDVFGYRQRILGSAKVLATNGVVATMEIVQAFDPIERGALVANWTEAVVKAVRPRPNRQALSGVIVGTHQGIISTVGEHHVVYVDRGRTDGVEEGNVFTVVRSGDPYGRDPAEQVSQGARSGLPFEDIGLLMVVDARETTSAAVVVRSLRELYVGDRVEMRGPPTGQAGPAQPAAHRTSP